MFWMRPVAWGRWSLAALIIGLALLSDIRGPATERYPFAAATYPAGTPIEAIEVEWRDVPAGLLPATKLAGHLSVGVGAGTPLGPPMLRTTSLVPDDWWVVELPLNRNASPGTEARVVVLDPPTTVDGIVVAAPSGDTLGGELRGAVAVPATSADLVARAIAVDGVVTLLSARTGSRPIAATGR